MSPGGVVTVKVPKKVVKLKILRTYLADDYSIFVNCSELDPKRGTTFSTESRTTSKSCFSRSRICRIRSRCRLQWPWVS